MIKNLLTIAAICVSLSTIKAQNFLQAEPAGSLKNAVRYEAPAQNQSLEKTSAIAVGDTLWYFLNKHYYRNLSGVGYYTFLSPNTSFITHCGSNFNNTNPNLSILGLEGVVSRVSTSPSPSVTVRLYLTNVVGGVPVLPALDSITAVCTGTSATFASGNFAGPKFVSGDYAVLFKCASAVAGDQVKLWMNNAHVAAATATTAVTGSKYGEGYGYIRAASSATTPSSFYVTTGAFINADTDFEFLVAPRVAFSASAAQAAPTGSCAGIAYTFTNNSSYQLAHRQYNLNEFSRFWAPFSNTVATIAADSVFTWNFGDATGNFYTVSSMPNIAHTYGGAGTFTGTLTAKYQKMTGSGYKMQDATTFAKTIAVCSGIQTFSGVEAVNVYPNPSTGIVNIANLPSETSIEVVNMLGQSVYSLKTTQGDHAIDLSTLPNGSYFVKISSVNEKTKIVKLILN
jgi:hypothetical protein